MNSLRVESWTPPGIPGARTLVLLAALGLVLPGCAGSGPQARTWSIGGTVEGLEGTGLVLTTAGQPELALPSGAAVFRFAGRVPSGTAYAVSVAQQPAHPRQRCSVAGASGAVADADVESVLVSCRRLEPRVAAGIGYSAAIRADGTLWAWGSNDHGELGDGTTTARPTPEQVGSGFTSVAATTHREWGNTTAWTTYGFTLAIDAGGTLWAWGSNGWGQLGDGTSTDRHTPVPVGSGFVSVAAGDRHAMAIKADGTLWAWGANDLGQLGDGTHEGRLTPVQVGSGFASVAAGSAHTLAIRTDGTLWAWGSNYYGALGDGTFQDRDVPVQIGADFAVIAAAAAHTAAVKTDGTLWSWGQDGYRPGEYQYPGDGAPVQRGSSFVAVVAGTKHFAAIGVDGTLWTWGWNEGGQLGDGTTTDRPAPLRIASGFTSVAAGLDHTLAVGADGTLWAFGANASGQLGDGTVGGHLTPVRIGSGFGD